MNPIFSNYLTTTGEVGYVRRVTSSLVYVEGLPSVAPQERVMYENGATGYVSAFDTDAVETISLTDAMPAVGMRVARTNTSLTIPVGEELLGMISNPLGEFLLSSSRNKPRDERPVFVNPLPIRARERVTEPCYTGVTAADLLVPLGKGQRVVVIGDQKTGKSLFLLRTLLTQVQEGSIGIYVAVGKSKLALRSIEEFLRTNTVFDRIIIIAAHAEDPAGLIYLAPYTGMTIAEYFRDKGNNVTIVIDDLSMHAKMYRELSLLGRRAPGRNSYPGDIFYIHAHLMERAGNFKTSHGPRSITCLPVIEVPRGDITGYISTNTLSMTDGHILFDYNYFVEGKRPSINPFLSVTRVGRQTQSAIRREISKLLMETMTAARQIETVSGFGGEYSKRVVDIIEKERRINIFLNQPAVATVTPSLQLYLFALVWNNIWPHATDDELHQELRLRTQTYTTDKSFRTVVDTMIKKHTSLDTFLQAVVKQNKIT